MTASRLFALGLVGLVPLSLGRSPTPPPAPGLSVTAAPKFIDRAEQQAEVVGVFFVKNSGTTTLTSIQLSCSASGVVTCVGITPVSIASLAPGAQMDVDVSYATGSAGSGIITLTATASGGTTGSGPQIATVLAGPTITLEAPILTTGSRAVVHTRQPVVRARYVAAGSQSGAAVDSSTIQLKWRAVDVTSAARVSRGLLEWEPDSTEDLGTVGSATADSAEVSVHVCAVIGSCRTTTRWVVLQNDQQPILGLTGMPFEALGRAFASPVGPGLSLVAGEIEAGVGTVPYVSMGSPRSTGLVYSTRQSYPRTLVPVDLELTWPAGNPDDLTFILKDGATRLDSVRFVGPTCTTGAVRRCRAVLQGDFGASTFTTPSRKWLAVEARVKSGATTKTSVDSVEIVLVDRRATRYGAGWWPTAGVMLVAAGSDRLLVAPNGAVSVFRGTGDSLFIPPPGSEVVMKKVGTTFELSPRGSVAKSVFDASGRLVKALDINGNKDSVSWEGSTDKILKVRDPLTKEITFNYTGGGTFTHFTSLSGGGARETRVTINGTTNQLTRDSLSSDPTKPYTTDYVYQSYPGTKTVVLTTRIGVMTDTTIVIYDSTFKRRPVQVKLPLVTDSSGAEIKPTITYTAREYQGIGALRALDSAYVQLTDPRGFWTRSLVDRWGQATRTWDEVGSLGRAAYLMDGRTAWSEGKVTDSSRVWSRYDALRRLAKTYWVRAAGDTLRLDSLVYDANHRVIKRFGPRSDSTRITYDAVGNLLQVIDPSGATQRFVYLADGRVDTVVNPDMGPMHYSYETTWKNRWRTFEPSGLMLAETAYDAYGRDTLSQSRIRVQDSAGTTLWQWRKVRTWYTGSNEVDSSRVMRGDNCTPCGSPFYPGTFDSLHQETVATLRDRGGRDTARVDQRGKQTTYRLDRLGRVLARRPWADSAAVKDSLVYDLAGNVIKAITRRGFSITTNYDRRNRDTLTVIPTVGTRRSVYAGPADQMTRQWLEGATDSIGGVNGELRWAFDQRGRLTADTSYTGATVRVRSYSYDIWERPGTVTDAVGAWITKYETARGVADTLLTPLGDSVTAGMDGLGRLSALVVRGPAGSPVQYAWRTRNLSGALEEMSHIVNAFSSPQWNALAFTRQEAADTGGAPLIPTWIATDGVAVTPDTLKDSVAYDGWGRVREFLQYYSKPAHPVIYRDYAFDRAGNILPVDTLGVETATYDATTNRLLRRTTSTGGSVTSSYDRAGNLTQRFDTLSPPVAWAYGYDALERLVSVRRNGTLIARYGYDVQGRRIVKRVYSSVSGGTVGYLRMSYAGSQVAFETDSAGSTLLTQYTWGPGTDQLVSLRVAGTHYVAVTDALGSVRALVKRDGTWAGRLRYDPYGKLVDSAGPQPALRYRWTGREWDAETGFYFHRTRYYDPQAQRFVQEDPIGYAGSGNLYAYVSGDVLQARDPDGLMKRYVIAGGGGWGYMCLGIDACFSGFGDLMNVGGGTWGERQAAGLMGWGAGASSEFDAVSSIVTFADGTTIVVPGTVAQCKNGKCPGGLTEAQYERVLWSMGEMTNEGRARTAELLAAGRIRSADAAFFGGGTNTRGLVNASEALPRSLYLNSNYYNPMTGQRGDFIIIVPLTALAYTIGHESWHIVQLNAYDQITGPSYRRANWQTLEDAAHWHGCQSLLRGC